jgi:hypothetical protein
MQLEITRTRAALAVLAAAGLAGSIALASPLAHVVAHRAVFPRK